MNVAQALLSPLTKDDPKLTSQTSLHHAWCFVLRRFLALTDLYVCNHIIVLSFTKFPASAFPFSGSNITNILGVPEVPVSRLAFSWNNLQFRICPLGASIVNGFRSTDGNGFRDGLRKQLIADGARVNMIGSLKTGAMVDNDVVLSRQQIIQRC